jgi:hypothetical protein
MAEEVQQHARRVSRPPAAAMQERRRSLRDGKPESLSRRNTLRTGGAASSENNAWAGGVAGFVAGFLLYPCETISMRYKVGARNVFKHMYESEGLLTLWSGTPASMIGTIPSSALYFVAYEGMKSVGEANLKEKYHPLVHMTSGCLSELISSVIYVPFEVIKARMQLGKNPYLASDGAVKARTNYRNSLTAFYDITKMEGLRGLYAGFVPCLLTDMSFRGLQFLLYEMGKKRLITDRYERTGVLSDPTTQDDLLLGFAAGAIAAFVSNPFDVVTVQLMVGGLDKNTRSAQAVERTVQKMKVEGLGVLFRGSFYRVASLAPHSAVTLAVFQWMIRLLER